MLKELLVDLALLVGPHIKRVKTVSKDAGMNIHTLKGYVSAVAETDYIEARPYDWQKQVAAFAIGCSLTGIGAGGSNRVADRFVWRTEDYENFDGIERQRGVYPDEMRTDLSVIMRQPAVFRRIAESDARKAKRDLVEAQQTPDALLKKIKLKMAQVRLTVAQKNQRQCARKARLEEKVAQLLCISIENPVPQRKVHRFRPADITVKMKPVTL